MFERIRNGIHYSTYRTTLSSRVAGSASSIIGKYPLASTLVWLNWDKAYFDLPGLFEKNKKSTLFKLYLTHSNFLCFQGYVLDYEGPAFLRNVRDSARRNPKPRLHGRSVSFSTNNSNNFCFSHGFVPNGGRVYYLIRSQPPLLIAMVYEYFLSTGDLNFVMVSLWTNWFN
jgi:hypothetical protein